jgi:topoisomerase IA-like protein
MHSIVLDNISIERLHSIEKEREQTMYDENFIQWCKQMNIGARVEVKDYKAGEFMQQYVDKDGRSNYPKWVQNMYI